MTYNKKNKTTGKKVKVVGKETYINAKTGEIEEMQVTSIEDRDFNFTKVWFRNFIAALDIVGNKKTKLCYWIIDNINKENMLVGTLRQIADKSGTSLETTRVTINILMDADFLRRLNQGVYVINPNVVFKGSRSQRLNVLTQYSSAVKIELSDEEKLNNLMESIDSLTKKAQILQEKIESKNQQIYGQTSILNEENKKIKTS